MKIALVHDFLFTYGGAERVLQEFHELYPEAPIYTLFADPNVVAKHFPNATIVTSPLQRHPLRRWPWTLLGGMPLAIESLNLKGFDIVLSSSGAFSHGVITGAGTKHICYCHTPMRYAWDWHHEYLAERGIRGFLPLLFTRSLLSRLRLWDSISAKRVDTWLANSTTVQSRISKYYRAQSTVINPPVDDGNFSRELIPLTKRKVYYVTASRLTPNKRIDLIIAACAAEKIPLKILGEGSDKDRLQTMAQKLGANVSFAGYATEEKKRDIIAEAKGFIFAAEDDFGLAPAEALALGTPILAFGKGGITDMLKEGQNGISFNEPTPESLAAAMKDFTVRFSAEEIRRSAQTLTSQTFKKTISEIISHA